ncbi:MAG TPA: CHAT domain-containing protein [Thermoanaerobaculia bacterium]|nr:CHAT domain-containing protein [Thermoanaerobaculia bacterium]
MKRDRADQLPLVEPGPILLRSATELGKDETAHDVDHQAGRSPRRQGLASLAAQLQVRSFFALLVFSLVVAFLWLWSPWSPKTTDSPPEASLVDRFTSLYGERSPAHGRLGPGPPLRLTESRAVPLSSFASTGALLVAAELEHRVRADRSPQDLHALGLLRLFEGRLQEAVALLEEASLGSQGDAEILADLATASLELGLFAEQPAALLRALDTAIEALQLDPTGPVPAFNFAQVLDELGLEHQAKEAWSRYLELDPTSDWAAEARRHRDAEGLQTRDASWAVARREVDRRMDLGDLRGAEELVTEVSAKAREEVYEKVFGAWAEAVEADRGEEAERLLRLARLVGSVSASQDSDHTLDDAIAAIDRVRSEGGRALRALVFSHQSLTQGIAARRASDCERAEPLLEEAARELGRAGSPLEHLARLNLGICLYYQDSVAARAFLQDLLSRLSGTPYPALLGRTSWMLGLAEAQEGDPWSAIDRYRTTAEALANSNDMARATAVHTLLAEAYALLGQDELAWDHRLEALLGLTALGDSQGIDRTLDEAVIALAKEGRLQTALLFQAEQIEHSRLAGNPEMSFAYVLMLQARLLGHAGRQHEALRTLQEALSLAADMPLGAERDRLEANLRAEEGVLLSSVDPIRALPQLDEALVAFSESGYSARLPELLHHRALARDATGDSVGAESDFLRAIDLVEERREKPKNEEVRISLFDAFQPIYDSAIRFDLEKKDDPIRAWELAVRAKSRSLLDRRHGLESRSAASTGSDASRGRRAAPAMPRSSIPAGTLVIEYAVLPEKLLIWTVRESQVRVAESEVTAETLERELDLWRRLVEARAPDTRLRELSAVLFDRLIRPVAAALNPGATLLFVPDRFLSSVPFGALLDRDSGRFLIEDHRVAVTPSASLLSASPAPRSGSRPRTSAVVVGNPAFDRRRFPELEDLSGSEAEAREVAALYPRAHLLVGRDATPERVAESLADTVVLHIAAHGHTDADGRATLVLAAGEAGRSIGLLDLGASGPAELAGVESAFLSTCTSAPSRSGGSREGISGLAGAFLGAGVPTVVGSLWPIDDRLSADLAVAFHQDLSAGADPVSALRAAQLSLLAGESAAHRSPGVWGSFELFTSTMPSPP